MLNYVFILAGIFKMNSYIRIVTDEYISLILYYCHKTEQKSHLLSDFTQTFAGTKQMKFIML